MKVNVKMAILESEGKVLKCERERNIVPSLKHFGILVMKKKVKIYIRDIEGKVLL